MDSIKVNLILTVEQLQLTHECLSAFSVLMRDISKLPIKKAKKRKGAEFIAVIDKIDSIYSQKLAEINDFLSED